MDLYLWITFHKSSPKLAIIDGKVNAILSRKSKKNNLVMLHLIQFYYLFL